MIHPELANYLEGVKQHLPAEARLPLLQPWANALRLNTKKEVFLNFICTHNSRRSQFSQVWAHVWAKVFQLDHIHSLSSGTEATACHPYTLEALASIGFEVHQMTEGNNPMYHLSFDFEEEPISCFSKTFADDQHMPPEYWAMMTCSDADENCPFIPSAQHRFPLNYQDPKRFDQTAQRAQAYAERCLQIATEFYWVFKQVKPS